MKSTPTPRLPKLDPVLPDFEDSAGRIGRPVVTSPWPLATDIRLESDRLEWRPGGSKQAWAEPSPRLLDDFVALRERDPEGVLKYAQRWGVLYLCEHNFPAGHPQEYWLTGPPALGHPCPFDEQGRLTQEALRWDRYRKRDDQQAQKRLDHLQRHGDLEGCDEARPEPPKLDWSTARADVHRCEPRGLHADAPWEPIDAWQTWARRAYALLAVAADLREGKLREKHWRSATGTEEHPAGPGRWEPPRRIEDGWQGLARVVHYWLGAARVRLWLQPGNGELQPALGSSQRNSPLFGAIAIQLAVQVCGARGFAICSHCKNQYAPDRTPRPDERNYCPNCRDEGAPQRRAIAAHRKRKRQAVRRGKAGEPVESIAADLGSKVKTVRRWLRDAGLEPVEEPTRRPRKKGG